VLSGYAPDGTLQAMTDDSLIAGEQGVRAAADVYVAYTDSTYTN